jgi:hypothetical protein
MMSNILNDRNKCDHSPPSGAEVKKMWIYKSTPPYIFMVRYLIN